MEGTSMCHLPAKLVGEKILTRVPITSLRSVRSTCKLWNALTKNWILGKAEQFFLGFMTKESKVCSVRFHLCRNKDKEADEDLLDLSIKQVDLLDQVKISRVFHCDGLLLCVDMFNPRLLMWNPYLGQTQWIGLKANYVRFGYCYALGYDINHNHKILRFMNSLEVLSKPRYEIYEFSSNSWKDLKVTLAPDQTIEPHPSGVSLKGNTYFYVQQPKALEPHEDEETKQGYEYFLLCFDFTTESFGPCLPLPYFHDNDLTFSCVREEKLALLQRSKGRKNLVQIWVTTTIGPNHVSWSPFLRVQVEPFALTDKLCSNYVFGGSFFIDEKEKVAVVFDFNRDDAVDAIHHHMAFVIGEGGFFKSVSLGLAHNLMNSLSGSTNPNNPETDYCTSHVCPSSYLPSLVQLNQLHKEE